ncbi:MAG: hypothetical protein RSE93_02320 [Oscillospiraceae bacterium]
MKNKLSDKNSYFGVGISSVLIVLTVFAIVAFSVLSLSSATADKKLCDDLKNSVIQQSKAENMAEETISKADNILSKIYAEDENGFIDKAYNYFIKENITQKTDSSFNITYSFSVDENRNLIVQLMIKSPKKDTDGFYDIVLYNVENNYNWQEDDILPVYNP